MTVIKIPQPIRNQENNIAAMSPSMESLPLTSTEKKPVPNTSSDSDSDDVDRDTSL